jgi:hypothetical protein
MVQCKLYFPARYYVDWSLFHHSTSSPTRFSAIQTCTKSTTLSNQTTTNSFELCILERYQSWIGALFLHLTCFWVSNLSKHCCDPKRMESRYY